MRQMAVRETLGKKNRAINRTGGKGRFIVQRKVARATNAGLKANRGF